MFSIAMFKDLKRRVRELPSVSLPQWPELWARLKPGASSESLTLGPPLLLSQTYQGAEEEVEQPRLELVLTRHAAVTCSGFT